MPSSTIDLLATIIENPVANASSVASIDVSSITYSNGVQIFVRSLNSFFTYDPTSVATADNVTVIQPLVGSGRWLVSKLTFSTSSVLLGRTTASAGNAEEVPIIVSTSLTGSSNANIPSTAAIKAYVDNLQSGDVVGPSSATDNAVARFDGVTGKLIQNSLIIVDDSGNITGAANISATGATISGLTASQAVITDASKNLASLSYSQSATASSLVQRDSNKNIFINNYFANATLTVSAGGTTVLTAASSRYQALSGSSSQTYQLPDATTLPLGPAFVFNNNSSGSLIINNAGGSTLYTVPAGGFVQGGPTDISTTNGAWDWHPSPPSTVTWGSGITGFVMNTALTTSPSVSAGISSSTAPAFIPQRGSATTGYSGDSTHLYGIIAATASFTSTATTFNIPSGANYQINGSQIAASNLSNGTTGSGAIVLATSPSLTTPALGTPSSGTLTNCTGLPVAGGGTGAASFTAYSVICAGTTSTGAFQNVSGVGTSGQVLTSNGASALPTWQNATGGGITWNTTSGTSATLAANNAYFANNASLVTFSLPVSSSVGDTYIISYQGSGGWAVAQNSGQKINFGSVSTTTGVGGSLASSAAGDTVTIVCQVANTTFQIISSIGNITYV